jgi:hypothetical protein
MRSLTSEGATCLYSRHLGQVAQAAAENGVFGNYGSLPTELADNPTLRAHRNSFRITPTSASVERGSKHSICVEFSFYAE